MAAQLFSNAYKRTSKSGLLPTYVHDIFAVPDIVKYLSGNFHAPGRFAKEEWTIRQFIFEAVTPSDEFPLGCKGTYRHYAEDNVIEVWSKADVSLSDNVQSTLTPYLPVNCRVKVFPEPSDARPSGGFFLLNSVPQTLLGVCPFVEGSVIKMAHTLEKVRNYFRERPAHISQWEDFATNYFPFTDDANEYVMQKPLRVPFLNEVFTPESRNNGAIFRSIARPLMGNHISDSLLQAETTDTFQWRHGRPVDEYRQLLPDDRLQSTIVPIPAHRRERNERTHARQNNPQRDRQAVQGVAAQVRRNNNPPRNRQVAPRRRRLGKLACI
jgi:hypothetical protein